MPRLLKDLQINDVSSVDRGAGKGVKVMLMKRDAPLPAEVEEYLKRTFSASERDAAASSGAALPDGSFPIKDKQDLSNAIRAIGRAKDPAKAKAHIKSRARALGASDMLPDSWGKSLAFDISEETDDSVIDFSLLRRLSKDGAVDFNAANDVQESREAANGLMCELNDAICALSCSVNSIMCDDEVTDKATAVAQSFEQFKSHLAGLEPTEKAMTTALTAEQITKMVSDAVGVVTKELTDKVVKLEGENAILKLDPAEQEFCKAMSAEDKQKFAAKAKADRAKEMEDAKKAAVIHLPPEIIKRLENADANEAIVKNLQEKDQIATFAKRATDMGLPAEKGEIIRKAWGGDATAQAEVEKMVGELNRALDGARKLGKVFTEVGSLQGQPGKAYDMFMAKAHEFQKTEAGKGLTEQQAFSKVYNAPENTDLREQEKQERTAQRAA